MNFGCKITALYRGGKYLNMGKQMKVRYEPITPKTVLPADGHICNFASQWQM